MLANIPHPNATPLFGIVAHYGSYEDAYQETLFVTPDEQAAHAFVAYKNALYASMRVKYEQSYADGKTWMQSHPQPTLPSPREVELPVPSWAGIRTITPEMRAERKRLKEENARLMCAARAPYDAWREQYTEVIAQSQEASMTAEEKAIRGHDNETRYCVETLSWMPALDTLLPADALVALEATPT